MDLGVHTVLTPDSGGVANGDKGFSPVAYHGEYGTIDGKQTVPRADMTAVIRALLAIKATGRGIAKVTIWSD
eukprot:9763551-Karenia_brevis.AAC.1